MRKPRIGILGGMGPAATILLQQKILEAVKVSSDADHIPLLIDMNPQVPSRIEYLIHNRGENPGPILVEMARCIEANDVDAIAMPCCTAHHFAPEIARAIAVPFLNMVTLSAEAVARGLTTNSKVGVLASPANIKTGLFENALQPHGLTAVYPKKMDAVLDAIETIKVSGPNERVTNTVQSNLQEMIAGGVGGFIIGCTEFSLISQDLTASVPIIDALDILTAEIVGLVLDAPHHFEAPIQLHERS